MHSIMFNFLLREIGRIEIMHITPIPNIVNTIYRVRLYFIVTLPKMKLSIYGTMFKIPVADMNANNTPNTPRKNDSLRNN